MYYSACNVTHQVFGIHPSGFYIIFTVRNRHQEELSLLPVCYFLLGVLFNPEDGGDMLFRNVS
jgi:hypothetical protein